jgi:hypothetical protein
MKRSHSTWASLALMLGLSACGGGGGGGDPAPAPPAPPAPPALPAPPAPTAFALTGANAVPAGSIALGALDFTKDASDLLVLAAGQLDSAPGAVVVLPCTELDFTSQGGPGWPSTRTVGMRTHYDDNDGDRKISAGDRLTVEHEACNGFARKLSIAVTAYSLGAQRMEGRVELETERIPTATVAKGSYTLALTRNVVSGDAWRATNVSVSLTIDATTQTVTGSASSDVAANGAYRVDYTASVESANLRGSFSVTTYTLEGSWGSFPSAGSAVLSASASKVKVGPGATSPDRTIADWAVDATGSGPYGAASHVLWRALLPGTVFGVPPNSPPYLAVSIGPGGTMTANDTLVANTFAVDFDLDPLTTTIEWRRNGRLLPNQTATLPRGEHHRGDTIELTVTVNDGALSRTERDSTVIADAPPIVILSTAPPATIAHGQPLALGAQVIDRDGDPLGSPQFRVQHGPPGFTVDPATGTINWATDMPMFDRMLDVSFGVTTTLPDTVPASWTMRVEDPDRAYPLMRTGIEAPGLPNLRVGDFDADGDEEMLLLGSTLYELEWDGAGGYRQSWMYPFAINPLARTGGTFAVADTDGDSHVEIFFSSGDTIVKLDGRERREVLRATLPDGLDRCVQLEAGDLNRDGVVEVVCNNMFLPFGLLLLDSRDLSKIADLIPGEEPGWVTLGNVDSDPAIEIVAQRGFVIDGATRATEWRYTGFGNTQGFGNGHVTTGDLERDGVSEILAGDVYSLRIYDAVLKNQRYAIGDNDGVGDVIVADVAGDATPEIVALSGWAIEGPNVYAYNVAQRTATFWFAVATPKNWTGLIAAGDVDHDGSRELIWTTGAGTSAEDALVVAGDHSPWSVEFVNVNPSELDGEFRGGKPAGNPSLAPAPLFASAATDQGHASGRLIRMDPSTGDLRVAADITSGGFSVGISAAVSDFDADGTDEAFVASGFALQAYDFFAAASNWSVTMPVYASGPPGGLAVGDLTGDGRDDVAVLNASMQLFAIDPAHDNVLIDLAVDVSAPPTWPAPVDVAIADLDGDGIGEILAATTRRVQVFKKNAGPTFGPVALYDAALDVRAMTVGDTDGDGVPEVFVAIGEFSRDWSDVVRLDKNLHVLGEFSVPWRADSLAIEPSSSARKNLLMPTSPYGMEDAPQRIIAVDAASGVEVWRSPYLFGRITRGSIHGFRSGANNRLAIGTFVGMYVTR